MADAPPRGWRPTLPDVGLGQGGLKCMVVEGMSNGFCVRILRKAVFANMSGISGRVMKRAGTHVELVCYVGVELVCVGARLCSSMSRGIGGCSCQRMHAHLLPQLQKSALEYPEHLQKRRTKVQACGISETAILLLKVCGAIRRGGFVRHHSARGPCKEKSEVRFLT